MSDLFIALTSSISTTAVISIVLYLFRTLIETRLKNSVKHEFDSELEKLKTGLRNAEEEFKADLRRKEQQIAVLRSSAIAGLTTRQAHLEKRRIEAVDQLWSAVVALAPAKAATEWMKVIKFEPTAKEAARNPQFRELFKMLGATIKPELKDNTNNASNARPYLSPTVWAFYSAYSAVAGFAVAKQEMLKAGVDNTEILDVNALKALVQVAIPHQIQFIDEFGPSAFHFLLDELESRLLDELQIFLRGTEADRESVERSAEILKESERIMKSICDLPSIPLSFEEE